MKKKYLMFGAIGLLCVGNTFASLSVDLYQNTSQYSYGNGGEFTAITTGGSFVGDYAAVATRTINGQTGFQTFCIDVSDYFNPGTSYNVTLGSTTTATSGNQISIGTAYLYSQFAAGTLSGYNYTYGGSRVSSAGWLQKTFWALEGEISSSGVFVTSNPFYNDLLSVFTTISAAEANANGAYGVAVMELTGRNGAVAQSQLVETLPPSSHTSSVPEPSTVVAGALMLLPFGVSALRILRRKQATQII